MHRFLLLLLSFAALTVSVDSSAQTGQPTLFTPLHTYYMATSGCSDANAGTSPAAPWCSPNHSVVCGDVIVAAAGDYTSSFATHGLNFGKVSNCPSSSGGIDGTGGIYFATILCGGSDLQACKTTGQIWDMASSNWSVQGWNVTNTSCTSGSCGSAQRAFELEDGVHHLAIINDICYSVGSCWHGEDGGQVGNHGADYVASVGNIAVQASMNTLPEGAIDAAGIYDFFDQIQQTHVYIYNNYAWNNNGNVSTDSEAFLLDTWSAHPNHNNIGVWANNIAWNSRRMCINIFDEDGTHNDNIILKIYNNTCFHNNLSISPASSSSELYFSTINTAWTIAIHNNIASTTLATSPTRGGDLYGYIAGAAFIPGITVGNNIIHNSGTTGQDYDVFNGNVAPTGIFVDPSFNDTTDLLNNRSGNTPNCSGFINTTQCMGWNANTGTLTNPSVIYDLQPNPNCGGVTGQCSGKGFQLPSTSCVTTGDLFNDFPVWLKGMVYHHWDGSKITVRSDLATKPCNM